VNQISRFEEERWQDFFAGELLFKKKGEVNLILN